MVIKKIVTESKPASVAYAEVYPVANSAVAATNASNLLRNPNVQNAMQIALREAGIDEVSIAGELNKIRKSWDWRAKDAFVKHSSKLLGYGNEEGSAPVQVGNIVNNWKVSK